MIQQHAVLDLRWNLQRGYSVIGDVDHKIGLSVKKANGNEKGVFGGWTFNGVSLVISPDPFGYLPIFVWLGSADEYEARIIVGTSPIALVGAGAPGEPDREALGLWCRIGFCLGERTLFKHIRLAPRGKITTWSKGKATYEGPGVQIVPTTIRSIEEGVQGYCDLFRAAMHRRLLTEEFAMPLSGGRDSRMMLLESISLGKRPKACVTLSSGPTSNHPDTVLARELSKRVNVPLIEVESRSHWIASETRKHVTGGLLALEHTWMMPLWDMLRANYSCWFDGLGCGAITRGDLLKETVLGHYRRRAWGELTREFASYAFGLNDETLTDLASRVPWVEASFDNAVALVKEEFDHFEGAANPLTAMSFANWGGRAISLNPYMLCATHQSIHTPFMDYDLVQFLMGYPVELALKDDLQTTCVQRMYPTFADIPFDKDLPKPTKIKRPITRALTNRLATIHHILKIIGPLKGVGLSKAISGDTRTLSVIIALDLLSRASTSSGAKELLSAFGFGSALDRTSLAVD